MSDVVTKPSGYPTFFNLLLIALVPICFVAATLALISALPIGELAFRIGAACLLAVLPLLLTLRASAGMKRRRLRGLVRAPIAIALMLTTYATLLLGLYQWRGFRPPHLIAAADHLHRVYLLGESPAPLAVIEPKPPLYQIYDRQLPQLSNEETPLLIRPDRKPGVDGIEIWSTEGDLRFRFLGIGARTAELQFIDDHRLLAVRSTGRALLIDAEKGELIRAIDAPELMTEIQVQTSSGALAVSGKIAATGELAIHYFDLVSGERRVSLRSTAYVAVAVTSDLRRALIVERGKRGELVLRAHHLPSGEPESSIPTSILVDAKKRKLKAVSALVAIGGGEQALLFDGTSAQGWDLLKKKPLPAPLAKAKLYPYGVAPGGLTYFHRRVDAGDPNPTGLYRLPSGEKLNELPVRGQPPRAFFSAEGRTVAVGDAVFSTRDGALIAGRMPESFTLDREHFTSPARDGSAYVAPQSTDRLSVLDAKLAPLGVVPKRAEQPGVVAVGGKLYAVPVVYSTAQWRTILQELDEWHPTAPRDEAGPS